MSKKYLSVFIQSNHSNWLFYTLLSKKYIKLVIKKQFTWTALWNLLYMWQVCPQNISVSLVWQLEGDLDLYIKIKTDK